jgi:hypothetical protein
MGLHTPIEWCDHSWPIVNGCRRASPGCENCYSERLTATRLAHTPKYKGLAVFDKGPRYTGETRLWEPHLTLPFEWKTPAKIFVADMGDLFYEQVLAKLSAFPSGQRLSSNRICRSSLDRSPLLIFGPLPVGISLPVGHILLVGSTPLSYESQKFRPDLIYCRLPRRENFRVTANHCQVLKPLPRPPQRFGKPAATNPLGSITPKCVHTNSTNRSVSMMPLA